MHWPLLCLSRTSTFATGQHRDGNKLLPTSRLSNGADEQKNSEQTSSYSVFLSCTEIGFPNVVSLSCRRSDTDIVSVGIINTRFSSLWIQSYFLCFSGSAGTSGGAELLSQFVSNFFWYFICAICLVIRGLCVIHIVSSWCTIVKCGDVKSCRCSRSLVFLCVCDCVLVCAQCQGSGSGFSVPAVISWKAGIEVGPGLQWSRTALTSLTWAAAKLFPHWDAEAHRDARSFVSHTSQTFFLLLFLFLLKPIGPHTQFTKPHK